MIDPEEIEIAESNGNFSTGTTVSDGLDLTNSAHRKSPSAYSLFQEYSDSFSQVNKTVVPKNQDGVIAQETIKNGHKKGRGPSAESYDVELTIIAGGSLELEDGTVVDGDMIVTYNYYIDN